MMKLFKNRARPVSIQYKNDAFSINEVPVSFPTSTTVLYEALGKPSRSGKTKGTQTTIDCWDRLGIYANYASSSHILDLLLLTRKHPGLEMQPKRFFSGEVMIEGKAFAQLGPHAINQILKEE